MRCLSHSLRLIASILLLWSVSSHAESQTAPTWTTTTFTFAATEDEPFSTSIASDVISPNANDDVEFSLISGPAWLTVTPDGTLSGSPQDSDEGMETFIVRATDITTSTAATPDATVTINVTHIGPVWTKNPIVLPNATDASPYSASIESYAQPGDPSDQLTFSLGPDAPSWLTIDSMGELSGSPATNDVGSYNFSVTVTDETGASAIASLQVKVTNVGPQWTQNTIVLPTGSTGFSYSQGVLSYVSNPANGTLNFSLTGPSWASIDPNAGVISGTPADSDFGTNSFQVAVFDETGAEASATVQINVTHLPPSWTQNPIVLPNANDSTAYTASIGSYALASDPGDTLTITGGADLPFWITLSSSGVITASPTSAQVGPVSFSAIVTDQAGMTASTIVQLTVVQVSQPPVWTANQMPFSTEEDELFSANIASNAISPNSGATLTFSMVSGPSWLSVSPNGVLSGTPLLANDGPNVFVVRVTDNLGEVATPDAEVIISVSHLAPQWTENPVVLPSATDNTPYSTNIAAEVTTGDPSDSLTFRLSSNAPSWISITPSGSIQATPTQQQIGNYTFSAIATDQTGSSSTGTLQLAVIAPATVPVSDVVKLEASVAGAASENLWVVDNHSIWDPTIRGLKGSIQTFYNALYAAQGQFSSVYLSSNAADFDGYPIYDDRVSPLMSENENDIVGDFLYRVRLSYSPGFCSNCNNSPLWSLYRFYQQAPTISSLWHNGYFVSGTPMDVMIVSSEADNFLGYSENVATVNKWSVSDFASNFSLFHQKTGQPYRISVITSDCSPPDGDTYQQITKATHGVYYGVGCNSDITTALSDYASKVNFRAAITTHAQIVLSQPAYNSPQITVALAGVSLPGNTGASSDLWTYNANKNAVILNWSLIDISVLKAGDQIQIQYETDNQ